MVSGRSPFLSCLLPFFRPLAMPRSALTLSPTLLRAERILPYDPLVSEARNEWRQTAFWSQNSHFVGWSAATTHFLEISALYPRFSEGVVSPLIAGAFMLSAIFANLCLPHAARVARIREATRRFRIDIPSKVDGAIYTRRGRS